MFKELDKRKPNEVEKDILASWKNMNILDKTIENRKGKKDFVFYDGPIYANAKPGIHHVLAKAIKDSFTYNSKICMEGKCDSKTNFITASSENSIALTVMRLNYEIKYDYSALGKGYNVNDFLARFGRIRYVIDGIKDILF